MEASQNCTKTFFHEDKFAQVTILHGGSFLHKSKKIWKKNYLKDKLIKYKRTKVVYRGLGVTVIVKINIEK